MKLTMLRNQHSAYGRISQQQRDARLRAGFLDAFTGLRWFLFGRWLRFG